MAEPLCMWRCFACGRTASGRNEPVTCECGLPRSWVVFDEPRESPEEPSPGGAVRADSFEVVDPPRIPTGSRELDELLRGGFAQGSAVLIHGVKAAGKSRLTYRWASRHRCLIVHAEMTRAVARFVLESTGGDPARSFLLREPEGWEAEANSCRARVVVLDSLAAFPDPVLALRAAQAWAEKRRSLVLAIQQVTKAGEFRGSSGLAHWADYEVGLCPGDEQGTAVVELLKTRLEPAGSCVLSLAP